MRFNFSFHSIVLAAFALGTLLSCGGGGDNAGKDEVPYVLPAGTKIIIVCGTPTQYLLTNKAVPDTPAMGEIPMTPKQIGDLQWTQTTFTLTVASKGMGAWEVNGTNKGTLFDYKRTSSTSFDLSASWSGTSISFKQCEIPKLSDTYGSLGTWEYWQTNHLLFPDAASIHLIGGEAGGGSLQYEQYELYGN